MAFKTLFVIVVLAIGNNALAEQKAVPIVSDNWTTMRYSSGGGELKYLGTSNGEATENSAVVMAEQDAIIQMIKHYFGVKMKYSLTATESLSSASLSIDKAENSDSIELRGIVRSNVKIEKSESSSYRAWVQISIPEKSLREEKERLDNLRRASAYADHVRRKKKKAKEEKGMVPKLFQGMDRQLFVSRYPAPNTVIGGYPNEIFHYQDWNFCDGSFLGCYIFFSNGKLSRWDGVNPDFVDFARSVQP